MTGPDHYTEAERLVHQADHYVYGDGADPVVGHAFAAMAQVHATLALTAATAGGTETTPYGDAGTVTQSLDASPWARVL